MHLLIFLLVWILLGVCVLAIFDMPHKHKKLNPILELLYILAIVPTMIVGAIIMLIWLQIHGDPRA